MTTPASGAEAYYANFGDKSVADYVTEDIFGSPSEMERLRFAVSLVPDGVTSLLDVGAGPGVFLHLLRRERGIAGAGIELTTSKVAYARDVLHQDVRVGSADRLPFEDASFDTVTAFEVIEHLPYGVYEAALTEVCRVARRHVIIGVPYREQRLLVECPYCAARFHPHYHMRSFDDDALRRLSPALRLTRLETHGEMRQLAWPFSRLAAARRSTALPMYALCPACGYREKPRPSTAAPASARRSWKSRVSQWIPRVVRPRWALAVYEKGSR